MTSNALGVEAYLEALPEDRKVAMRTVRATILKHLPEGYEEGMQYGMIGYYVPHTLFPAGHHCDPKQPLNYACLGSRKSYMSLHLMSVHGNPETRERFEQAYEASGKRLDMGQACVPFKRLEDLPLDVIGQTTARTPVEEHVARYLRGLAEMRRGRK